MTFGRKGKDIAFNGVSKNIADVLAASDLSRPPVVGMKNVWHMYVDSSGLINSVLQIEDFKELGDQLGTTRNLGQGTSSLPADTIFGKSSISKNDFKTWGAAETIKGDYGTNAARVIDDLGRSITPGFRNIATEVGSVGGWVGGQWVGVLLCVLN